MMPPKSKTFVCDQHASKISRKLQTFYQDQLFFDIALTTKTDNFKVHAHRIVLSASSDYFLAMLCSTLKEAKSDLIELGIDGTTLKLIIDFMYCGTIELSSENVGRILTAANVLQMNTLKSACSDFIGESIDMTNWLNVASMAKQQQSAELHKKALEFALQQFEEVCKQEEYLQITEEQLLQLISSDDLCVDSEETVFHSLVSWVEYDKENREKCMIDLLSHIRFSFLKPDFIIDNRHSISKTYECFELLLSWLESLTKLSKRHSKRKNANRTEIETLGLVSGECTENLKFQTLDPELNIWSCEDLPPPPTNRISIGSIVIDKKLIIAGGLFRVNCIKTNTVECLDLQRMEWTNLPPMRQNRSLPGMAELNGDLYVVGGLSENGWSSSVEKYDFRKDEWTQLASMNLVQENVKVTVLGGLLYAGGSGGSSIDCYSPTNNKWARISHQIGGSTNYDIAGVGGYLYAVGFYDGYANKAITRYNPSTGTWMCISLSAQLASISSSCVSWNNRLIACRGMDSQERQSNFVEEYNPETNDWKILAPLSDPYFKSSILFIYTK